MPTHTFTRRVASFALLFASIALLGLGSVSADPPKPFLHPLFTDNMVLQRGMADPIWGWTTPGGRVFVRMNGKTAEAVAGPDGKWAAKIGPFPAGGPYTLTVGSILLINGQMPSAETLRRAGGVTLKNVMVGDVWLCSGQSNMEFGVGNLAQPEQTIAGANAPNIRLFTVPKNMAASPQETLAGGQWQACTPETIKSQGTWNGFSAVAYFFGRDLQQNTHVPIGLLLSSWGGTPAEAWTSEAALKKNVPEFDPQLAQLDASRDPGTAETQAERFAAWYAKNDPGTPAHWQNPDFNDAAWNALPQPGFFQLAGDPALAGVNGVVWYRRTFDLPAQLCWNPADVPVVVDTGGGKNAVLHLLADDNDTTWVNGVQVGATEGYKVPRAYPVPASLLKPAGNVVAVRLLDTGGNGGLYDDPAINPAGLSLEVPGGQNLPLAGPWRVHLGVSLASASPLPVSPGNNPNLPSVLYNGLISPLATFGIKGTIWYQGETNEGRDAQYRRLLPALISDWRQAWGEGSFPFLIVQLAGWQPAGESLAKLRDAQWQTARTVPSAGIATAIDVGDPSDIHPKNKQEVGRRLALVAEAKAYGEKVAYSGPVWQSMTTSGTGHILYLSFSHAEGGLVSKSGPALTGFEVAGADGVFVPADAKIAGKHSCRLVTRCTKSDFCSLRLVGLSVMQPLQWGWPARAAVCV